MQRVACAFLGCACIKSPSDGRREKLRVLAARLRELDVESGGHTAAADLLFLYASTQVWFASERDYKVRRPVLFLPPSDWQAADLSTFECPWLYELSPLHHALFHFQVTPGRKCHTFCAA